MIYISNEIEDTTTSIFCGFTITNGLAAEGAGIYITSSNPKMYNLVISNNQANVDQNKNYGGGIFLRESDPFILTPPLISPSTN